MPIRSARADANQLQRLIPGLPTEAGAELAGSATAVTYARGETILGPDSAPAPGVVVDGAVRLIVRSADGREATLRTTGRGSMFGLVTLFDTERSVVTIERSIVALETTTVILLDRATVLRAAARYAGFALHIARNLADSASFLTDTAGQLALMTVRQRLAGHLLAIAIPRGQGHRVALVTQQELAASIGTVREVVARTLHDLREDGFVAVSPGRIEILDERGLTDTAFGVT
jgi:CRP/FNR family transcriptional regulator, cyclic AMP receptor protein